MLAAGAESRCFIAMPGAICESDNDSVLSSICQSVNNSISLN